MPLTKVTTQVVRVRDELPRIIKDYRLLDNAYTAVGWSSYSGKYPDGTPVALVALWNEFGTHNENGSVRSPARPFMRPAYQDNKSALDALRRRVVESVNAGRMTPHKALDTLGYRMWSWIRAKILSNPAPALRPRTLAKKRAAGRPAVTLIDTRRMLDSLTYKIYLGRFFSSEQSSAQAAGAQARARAISGEKAAQQRARHDALRAKVMTAKQIKREKRALRAELAAAKAAKKREGQRLTRQIRVAKARNTYLKTRQLRRQKRADKAYNEHVRKQTARYAQKDRRTAQRAQQERRATEARVAKHQRKERKRYVSQVGKAIRAKAKKDRKMAARDRRQEKGLSRIRRLTPKQKEANLAREKLQRANAQRLRQQKRDEQREVRAEKVAKTKAVKAARTAKKKAKTASRAKGKRKR